MNIGYNRNPLKVLNEKDCGGCTKKRKKYDTCTKLTYFFQGSLSLMLKKEEKI
jgi:hypothetical protein